jgi:hypothetical protein
VPRVRLQRLSKHWKLAACVAATAGLLAGCANGPSPLTALPKIGDVTTAATPPSPEPSEGAASTLTALLSSSDNVVGSPTDVYTRIARGVLTCWFGAAGPLKTTHIYHAAADPASKGGKSEIEIFQKDPTASDPRSLRAYRVAILPSGSTAKVEVENIKIAEPLASRLGADVLRWSKAEGGCGDSPVTGGWAAHELAPAPEPSAKKAKQKH